MKLRLIPILALCVAMSVACAPRKSLKKTAADDARAAALKAEQDAAAAAAGLAPGVDVSEASIKDGGEFTATGDLQTVHFDYDAYGLQDDARAGLKKNSEYLRAHPDMDILVSGHCDERGTTEYNLALGQKRAKEVREYYIRLGIPGKHVATISYGEENPTCSDANDACWHQNRRVETRVRTRTSSNGSKGINPQAPQ